MKGNARAMKFLKHQQWCKRHHALATTINIIEKEEIQPKKKKNYKHIGIIENKKQKIGKEKWQGAC